jgi:hypothetical protein
MGGAPSVPVTKPPEAGQEFTSSLNAYIGGAGKLYGEEAQYQPMYNQLQQQMGLSNLQAYAQAAPGLQYYQDQATQQATGAALGRFQQYGGQAAQAAINADPYANQVQNYAQSQMAASQTPNAALQSLFGQSQAATAGQVQGFQQLAGQAGQMFNPTNQALQGLYQQAGTDRSGAQGFLTGMRNQIAANTRTPGFQQTSNQIMGQLGTTDPLLGQMQGMAQQGLALGSTLSPEQIANATQAARAGYSARGLVQSNPAVAAEVLSRDQYGQQLLASRQQFAGGVQQAGQAENQQQIANAMGLQQADIGQTQWNQQTAANLGMQIPGLQQSMIAQQSGLQGQISQNLLAAQQQQAGLLGQAAATQQAGVAQATGLQQAILGQQQQQQQQGMAGYQYLSGLAGQGIAGLMGTQSGVPSYLMQLGGQAGGGGPSLFNSSGLLQLEAQNQMAGYNQQNQANMVNAQSRGAASGAMLGAGAGIAGALMVGGVAL